jgi:hypothetical protein
MENDPLPWDVAGLQELFEKRLNPAITGGLYLV